MATALVSVRPELQEGYLPASAPEPAPTPIPPLDETHGRYRLRFARDEADLDRLLRLRFEVFNLELGEGLESSLATGRDRDPFDDQCHHVLVEDRLTGRAAGTYRVQARETAEAGRGFYSATEFDLGGLPDHVLDGAVEIGRACIAREHRGRRVLFLLWRALVAYARWNQKRFFFGLSSLQSQDPAQGLALHARLIQEGHAHPSIAVAPLAGCACPPGNSLVPVAGNVADDVVLPPLLDSYLRHGAKVCGPPAVDHDFGTIDFFTLLDFDMPGSALVAALGQVRGGQQ